jgi:hypothetical protein
VTYPETQTYWLDPTNEVAIGLRRYAYAEGECPGGYHDALIYTGRLPAMWQQTDYGLSLMSQAMVEHSDPRWPTQCTRCSYQFTENDNWQPWQELVYRRADTDTDVVLHRGGPADAPSAPPGAMWNASWMSPLEDGIYLMVRLPNGHDWAVDSEASNCTRKGQPHNCWCRHGDPREARVTVDKVGDTCAAGAGSIQGGDYHGFLRNGVLTRG